MYQDANISVEMWRLAHVVLEWEHWGVEGPEGMAEEGHKNGRGDGPHMSRSARPQDISVHFTGKKRASLRQEPD